MKTIERDTVSRATVKRLSLYLYLLENLGGQGVEYISCAEVARAFGFEPTQVRKDFEVTGEVGTPRIGFRVATLFARIREFLGWDVTQDAFLVGAGNLGRALLGYRDFEKYGLNMVAVFDRDPRKIGSTIFEKEIYPLTKLPELARKMHVYIGVVTVPGAQAQGVVDLMVSAGIKAIWNFAPAPVQIPKSVILENARLTQSLAILTHNWTRVLKESGRQ